MDHSLCMPQGLLLEPIGSLSQLLEAVNDPNSEVTMDQIGEAIEMAITLLANAVADEKSQDYNKELVTFAAEIGQQQQPHGCLAQTS